MHLICEMCDKIVDVGNHSVNSINLILQKDTNFDSINNNFVFVGKCPECD